MTRPVRWLYRVWDRDGEDYVELAEPIPDTDPRYGQMLAASRARLRADVRRTERGDDDA